LDERLCKEEVVIEKLVEQMLVGVQCNEVGLRVEELLLL
jgi:hypothetical protein